MAMIEKDRGAVETTTPANRVMQAHDNKTAPNFEAECFAANRRLTEASHDRLADAGIPKSALYHPSGLRGLFGVTLIETSGRFFQPCSDGKGALIVPVFEYQSEAPVDLLAFRLDDPGRFWLRTGDAVVLGRETVERAALFNETVIVHPTPLDWLRADCFGVCILDWRANLRLLFDGCKSVVASSQPLARRLRNAFTVREIPVGVTHE